MFGGTIVRVVLQGDNKGGSTVAAPWRPKLSENEESNRSTAKETGGVVETDRLEWALEDEEEIEEEEKEDDEEEEEQEKEREGGGGATTTGVVIEGAWRSIGRREPLPNATRDRENDLNSRISTM